MEAFFTIEFVEVFLEKMAVVKFWKKKEEMGSHRERHSANTLVLNCLYAHTNCEAVERTKCPSLATVLNTSTLGHTSNTSAEYT